MALQPSSHLGPYEVIAPLGAGGMGEVYKARDTRLDRTVAIKVLPSEFAQNVELRHRLEREARAIASLNHPHICILHDVGSQDGIDFLVMEYLEGETLASRLRRGALSQALEIAIPIADALDRAHRAGIVHRDLKPGNIILTKSGPKLLDFGLAKSRGPMKGSLLDSAAPTEEKTAQGILLGTLAYMAPEQLDGKETDARADVWALGAVLYEMVTGKRAFEGKSTAGLIAAILEHEAPALPHPLLNRVVQKCLAKDPDARFQSAGEVRELLRWVTESQAEAKTPTRAVRHWARAAWALAGAAAAIGILLYFRTSPLELPETRLEVVTPPTSDESSIALSPDGRSLVFVADSEGKSMLWLRRLDSTQAAPIASTEGAAYPFWSPDSGSIGFFAEEKLKRLDLGSGRARVLADASAGRGGAWSQEGVILFAPTATRELHRVSENGGEPVAVTRVKGQPRFPQFLPDQRHFVFYVLGGPANRGVYLGSLDSPDVEKLFDADAASVLGPSGFLFFPRGGTLLAQRFDARALELLVSEPVQVADELLDSYSAFLGKTALAGSPTMLAYRTGAAVPRQLVWFDRFGKVLGTAGPPDESLFNPDVSPDGQRIAFQRWVGLDRGIWILDSSRGTVSLFTVEESRNAFPNWSPDGTRLVFGRTQEDGVVNLYQKTVSGRDREERLLETPTSSNPCDWSRDGRFILYRLSAASRDLWVLPLEGDRKPFPFVATRFDERAGQFAPDGNFVAYQSNETGRFEIYLQPFPGPGEKSLVSTGGGEHPRWRPDGRELFYIAPDGSLMAVSIVPAADGKTLKLSVPSQLFLTRIVREKTPGATNYNQQYDVSPDGKRFLINVATEDSVTSPITLVLNWKPPEK